MRIAVEASTYHTNPAGVGVYTRNIVDQWHHRHRDVRLFHSGRESRIDHGRKAAVSRAINGVRDILWMQLHLPLRVRVSECDVLFCPAYLSPVFSPCPTVITVHDVAAWRHPETCDRLFRTYVRATLRATLRRVAAVLTDSEFSRSEIRKVLHVPESKIRVVYPGCGTEFCVVADRQRIEEVRDKYGLKRPFILHVGTLEPRKDIGTLVDALCEIRKHGGLDHQLVLCGSRGWYYDGLMRKIREKDMTEHVVFTGHVPEEDLPPIYNAAELLVLCSQYEGFGLTPLEAMACGCPVVARRVASVPEVVGDAAVLVDSPHAGELADAINGVLGSAQQRRMMTDRGLARAKRFSWQETAAKVHAALQEAAAAGKHDGREAMP